MSELKVRLISDATFGRGDGVAGLVDSEVEYEAETGLPFIRGRALKGLLTEECANILFSVKRGRGSLKRLEAAAVFLFGESGGTMEGVARMRVGSAMLPEQLRNAIRTDVRRKTLRPLEILESLTAIRRQTSIDEQSGGPEEGSLRSARVVLRETVFSAKLDFDGQPDEDALALLAACAMSLRRGGSGRNRGRGRLEAWLNDEEFTRSRIEHFAKMMTEAAS